MVVSAKAKPRTPNWTAPASRPASSFDFRDRVMSASVKDAAHSSDFVENGNARAVRIVSWRDKEFPKSWRQAKPYCRRDAIVAASRQVHETSADGFWKAGEPRPQEVIYFEIRKNVEPLAVSRFAGGEILL